MSNETITLIANIALTLSVVVAVVFGLAQVRAAAKDRRERLTLETLRNFQTRDFAELIHYVTTTDMPKTREEFEELPAERRIIFIEFSQQMEHLGILVADKLIDMDLVDKTLGSLVTGAWNRYQPMFMNMREKFADPYLGEYFQWLADQIDKRLRGNPRRPVFENDGHFPRK